MIRLLVPTLVIALCTGCSTGPEGTRGTGVMVTGDGRFVANTDTVQRSETAKHIQEDVDRAIAPHWRSAVAIDELPVWHDGVVDGEWQWHSITALVTLRGSGALPVSLAELKTGIEQYLAKKAKVVQVTMQQAGEPVASVPLPPDPLATTPPPAAGQTGTRHYTVQAGDTLADIATLFYGAPEAWRRITAANPGLDPATLTPGAVLVIPPRP